MVADGETLQQFVKERHAFYLKIWNEKHPKAIRAFWEGKLTALQELAHKFELELE